ncbi:2-succinyl-6-hydroxy-2,4-cyclohexadiene-1-carboxylate synthase [Endozoicomonas sp. OPT23]|uniref:2-succinyl-6-hydroxy-2, 4-cyclohexadiene-1-carboxylate synthase n=1 Tax=Endozoicomonas sp. OPT23 TaxID=2072845 RepID=UPI00129B55AC|nr:2-succinyl-6-hydroxy-2,4-cyclohexadiene-1-carboxylate synthase [Endozoicomonas sp. OPT23]MRI34729.1 2-succinyl-6-hydroxy-2,4-cyclohexadiene-1-carboxylate synthase [Endozoicomonas sp. OPT23]
MSEVVNLAYRTWGVREGTPVVLLHGFLGDCSDWSLLAEHLAPEQYLVAIDLPGHGHSRTVPVVKENAFEVFSELLSATLLQLDIKEYVLVGYSLGGRLAMYHAHRFPEGIQKLVVESSHPGLEDSERAERLDNDLSWASQFRTEPLSDVLTSWYHQAVFADLNSRVRASLMKSRLANNTEGTMLADALEGYSLAKQPSLWNSLGSAHHPIIYLHGDRDIKFQAIAHQLLEAGCVLNIHNVSNAGHNIHREQPEVMANVLREALQ